MMINQGKLIVDSTSFYLPPKSTFRTNSAPPPQLPLFRGQGLIVTRPLHMCVCVCVEGGGQHLSPPNPQYCVTFSLFLSHLLLTTRFVNIAYIIYRIAYRLQNIINIQNIIIFFRNKNTKRHTYFQLLMFKRFFFIFRCL